MEVFVARQPIFTKNKSVFAYELLYRSGKQNFYDHNDGDRATSDVITNSFSVIGIDTLTGGKRAFINFTQNLLKKEMATVIPPNLVVIELLEDIVPDDEILTACRKLKQLGYTLALDDFVAFNQISPLIDLADIIKVDFLKASPDDWKAMPREIGNGRIRFLAEKVETLEQYEEAVACGYSYFQGYFFSKPEIFSGQDLAPYKLNYLRIIREINQFDGDFDRIEEIVKQDVSLSYKLLRLVNSAAFGLVTKVTSIKYCLVLLGIKEFVKWVTLVSLRSIGEDKPDELVIISLIRARFAELLAFEVGMKDRSSDLFLMGMFSMIDALMDRPFQEIIDEVPVADDVKDALSGTSNSLREVYDLIIAYERGEWDVLTEKTAQLNVSENEVSRLYITALQWVQQIFS
ncbi:MAG TPA: HDOD domain-containing protein [Bacillota bacterium]|nr:HDOD domain-containing protein [Bacillota bacterium]